jgi:uncharacterized protein YvpB
MRGGRLARLVAVVIAITVPVLGAGVAPEAQAIRSDGGPTRSTLTAGESFSRAAPVAPDTGAPRAVWVPNYFQQRNLSCEYASAVIAMAAYGVWVSEWEFDGLIGLSENPHWGYRGDINGWWGNTEDYGVYAEPLVGALNAFGFWGDAFYAAGDSSALTSRLDQGAPTLVWIGMWGNTGFYEYTADGTPYKLVPGLHVVVAYDYDDSGVYVSDPATGSSRFFDWGTFMWMWNAVDGMGLAVGPM